MDFLRLVYRYYEARRRINKYLSHNVTDFKGIIRLINNIEYFDEDYRKTRRTDILRKNYFILQDIIVLLEELKQIQSDDLLVSILQRKINVFESDQNENLGLNEPADLFELRDAVLRELNNFIDHHYLHHDSMLSMIRAI